VKINRGCLDRLGSDRAPGVDAIMIAPTRHLVAQLNRRARAHRLNHSTATAKVLADANGPLLEM
jgi:hypothetical protein